MSGGAEARLVMVGRGPLAREIGMASPNCDPEKTVALMYSRRTGNRDRNMEGSMPNRVVHFEIISPEAEKIQKFFADVFDWAINTANPMGYGMVDTGAKDYGIQGGIAAPGPFGNGHITFYVEVDDVDAALAKAVAAGGTVAMPKINIGGAPGQETILAQFTDPLGNRYGLSQRHAQPRPAAAAARRPRKKAAQRRRQNRRQSSESQSQGEGESRKPSRRRRPKRKSSGARTPSVSLRTFTP